MNAVMSYENIVTLMEPVLSATYELKMNLFMVLSILLQW